MAIDLTSFDKALDSLKEILSQPINKFIRAGTVQCFEYTFELAWKSMQRILKEQGVSTGSPMQVFRAAVKTKMIDDLETWAEYLKQRNLTVHTYNEDTAKEVYNAARRFASDAEKLLLRLKAETR